jgi:hypothetical protein
MYCLHFQGENLVQVDAEIIGTKEMNVSVIFESWREFWPIRAMEGGRLDPAYKFVY